MEDISNDTISESQDEQKRTAKIISYPVKTLKECIAFVENVYRELGAHTYHDKDDIAKANKSTYFSIKQTLSTCQQYGLLELKHGGGYKPTELFISIVHPKSDDELRQSIITSLSISPIFQKLNSFFNGQRLPANSGITNTIIRDIGLKPEVASKVANIYSDNLKDYQLFNLIGLISFEVPTAETIIKPEEKPANVLPAVIPNNSHTEDKPETIDILIPLKGRKQAHLLIPENYTDDDLGRIVKFVDALRNDEPT